MIYSKLKNIAWVCIALTISSTTVLAQGRGYANRVQPAQQRGYCINHLPDLNEKQQEKINTLDEEHWRTMDELRLKQRAESNAVEKSKIRTTMLENVQAHREAVKKVLTREQQEAFDKWQNNNSTIGRQAYARDCRGQGRFSCNAVRGAGYGARGAGYGQKGRGYRNQRLNQNCVAR